MAPARKPFSPSDREDPPVPLPPEVQAMVERVAGLHDTVLLTGETGTGKSTLARVIHEAGGKSRKPFVRVDCGGLVSTLAQAELFGHEPGAFTDARGRRKGLVREAGSGTLFFDEIGVLSPEDQLRLLTLLEERTVRPLGASRSVRVNARILCATNADLAAAVERGGFRKDLFYRCAGIEIHLPPLRERWDELPEIVGYLLHRIAEAEAGNGTRPIPALDPSALEALGEWRWPGNLRELRNTLVLAVASGGGDRIRLRDLPPRFRKTGEGEAGAAGDRPGSFPTLDEVIREAVRRGLGQTGGNISQAARLLGIDRKRLKRMMKKYEIT